LLSLYVQRRPQRKSTKNPVYADYFSNSLYIFMAFCLGIEVTLFLTLSILVFIERNMFLTEILDFRTFATIRCLVE
jgi:hypothetical protein